MEYLRLVVHESNHIQVEFKYDLQSFIHSMFMISALTPVFLEEMLCRNQNLATFKLKWVLFLMNVELLFRMFYLDLKNPEIDLKCEKI